MQTVPVTAQEPICESDRVRVFDVPGSVLYRVEAVQPDGTTKVFDGVRAYTKSLQVDSAGGITIEIHGKSDKVPKVSIPDPYNYLWRDSILCALKIYDMKTKKGDGSLAFALNYNLFCLPWDLSIIVHSVDGQRRAFFASRAEWERGELSVHNREVQMFVSVPEERHVPLSLMKFVHNDIGDWISRATVVMARKGA